MSYIDVTGKTEEEAISKALAQLGMDRDDVSVEILERAKSGFLGMGAKPARVRVTYGPDEAPMEEVAVPVKRPRQAFPHGGAWWDGAAEAWTAGASGAGASALPSSRPFPQQA